MLLRLRNASLSYGLKPVLDRVDLEISTGERIGLLGRNGTGKSSLLRVVQGEEALDDGLRETAPQARIASLPQDVPPGLAGPVFDVVAGGLGEAGAALAQFHDLTRRLTAGEAVVDRLTAAQAQVDTLGGWLLDQRVEAAISRAGLEPGADFGTLSGGQQRRVLLARALVQEPDLLLLDEPTNHLDIDTIGALEASLREWHGALLFVTHDRAFLRRLATRILDLDRGHLTSWPGNYGAYLAGKAKALEAEARADARFDDRLAQEETWIRQGIKARRTRNEGRVRALKAMREERRERRALTGQVRLGGPQVQHGGKLVLETEDLNFGYPGSDRPLVKDLSTLVLRGDKIGIVGPNGSGKTTLIRLLLGELQPDSGSVRLGTRLDIVHFDQRRAGLDLDASVADNLGQGRTAIEVDGRSRHVMSYLQDFLFTPEQARAPARVLSGGERNRLLLARLFTQPCNLLVMDEPTNDLDLETLELLEARLVDWPGTLLLVSHDREFLDNIVTSTLVMESGGHIGEYVGGYSDWLRQRPPPPPPPQRPAPARPAAPPPAKPTPALSSAERRELGRLPARIETLERQIGAIHERMGHPDYYQHSDAAVMTDDTDSLRTLEAELEQAFERWNELEARQAR